MTCAPHAVASSLHVLGNLQFANHRCLLTGTYKLHLPALLQRGSGVVELAAQYEGAIYGSNPTSSRGQL